MSRQVSAFDDFARHSSATHDRDFWVVSADRARDPDGRKLREVLACHLAYERAHTFRQLLVPRLLMIGVVVWLLSAETPLVPHVVLPLALAALLAAVCAVAGNEWRWHQRVWRAVEQLQR